MKRRLPFVLSFTVAFVLALLPIQFAGGVSAFGLEGDSLPLAAGQNQDGAIRTAEAVSSVSYVERRWDDTAVVSETKNHEADPVPSDGGMTSGWYYLNSNVTVSNRIYLDGNTNLILGDGYTLDVKGLYVPAGSTLTIYGQSAGTGTIYSHPSDNGAAIGGYSGHDNGNIVIHGGTVTATGGCYAIGRGKGCNPEW